MPDMEGLELITILKTSPPSLTILAMSGSYDREFLEVAKRLGVKDAIQKPLTRAALLKTVESALTTKASSAAQ